MSLAPSLPAIQPCPSLNPASPNTQPAQPLAPPTGTAVPTHWLSPRKQQCAFASGFSPGSTCRLYVFKSCSQIDAWPSICLHCFYVEGSFRLQPFCRWNTGSPAFERPWKYSSPTLYVESWWNFHTKHGCLLSILPSYAVYLAQNICMPHCLFKTRTLHNNLCTTCFCYGLKGMSHAETDKGVLIVIWLIFRRHIPQRHSLRPWVPMTSMGGNGWG